MYKNIYTTVHKVHTVYNSTGQFVGYDYSFTIFPSKTTVAENGKAEKQVNLVIMDKIGNLKILGVDSEGEITQPRSHNFKLEEEHANFIKDFDKIARDSGYEFTDAVLQLVN